MYINQRKKTLVPEGVVYCWLPYHLEANGITPQELADAVGYGRKTISSWCAGNAVPSLQAAYRVADFLQVKLESIWRWERQEQ